MRLYPLLVLLSLSVSGVAAHADNAGTSVTGGLFFSGGTANYFNPSLGYVPTGYGNTAGTTVTIGPGVEFGFYDGANFDTADFTGTSLTVSDVDTYGVDPFEMTFTDPAFTGFTLLTNASGFTYTFSGHTLDVFFPGTFTTGQTFTATFGSAGSAPTVTPEPSGLMLLGTGALGVLGAARRRFGRRV